MSSNGSQISRRNFFSQLGSVAQDKLVRAQAEVFAQKAPTHRNETKQNPWVRLLRLSEMSPGRVFPFEHRDLRGVLYSNDFGVYAVLENKQNPELRVTPHGYIEMHSALKWKNNQILSHLTGLVMSLAEETQSDE